jgi:hypothetical protein
MKKLHKTLTKNLANYKKLIKDKKRINNATFYSVNNKEWQRIEHLKNVDIKIEDNLNKRFFILSKMRNQTLVENLNLKTDG